MGSSTQWKHGVLFTKVIKNLRTETEERETQDEVLLSTRSHRRQPLGYGITLDEESAVMQREGLASP